MNELKRLKIKSIMRIITLLCIVFVFCPSFLVSCSGQEVKVSAMDILFGLKYMGSYIVEPHAIMAMFLVLPIVILIVLSIKKMKQEVASIITCICSVCQLIGWIIFFVQTKNFVTSDGYFTYKVTPWYLLNTVCYILMTGLSVCSILKVLQLNGTLADLNTKLDLVETKEQLSNTFSTVSSQISTVSGQISTIAKEAVSAAAAKIEKENHIICPNCGEKIDASAKFCSSCGAEIPKPPVAEDQICASCGAKNDAGAKFCSECGTKFEEKVPVTAESPEENVSEEEMVLEEVIEKRVCVECSTELDEDALFCPSCGAKQS